jgi:TetR/AcrR family transcriptional repressor of nem operon
MVGAELATLKHPLVERVTSFYRDNEARLVKILSQGKESGEFRFVGDIQAMATLIFSLLEGGFLVARAHGGAAQYRAIVAQLMQLVKG